MTVTGTGTGAVVRLDFSISACFHSNVVFLPAQFCPVQDCFVLLYDVPTTFICVPKDVVGCLPRMNPYCWLSDNIQTYVCVRECRELLKRMSVCLFQLLPVLACVPFKRTFRRSTAILLLL